MRTFFRLILLGLVLLVVAMICALTAMRIAIHGREISVPDLIGKSPAEAARIAEQDSLPLEIERQYYSSMVPAGKIVSQVPAAGARVRKGWQVRVAESLGPQRVQIPSVIGESERAAEINIRRRGLDINSVATIGLPGMPTGRVLSQSPPANASDVAVPKISLLVSDTLPQQVFVMPNFIGQTLGRASSALRAVGIKAGKVSVAAQGGKGAPPSAASTPPQEPTISPASPASVIVSQNPIAGQKVIEGATVDFVVR